MNNTEEISQEENKSEIVLIGDENGDDQYLTELQHKFKKVAWQLFYPVWKSKGFRYGLLINYVAQLREGGAFFDHLYPTSELLFVSFMMWGSASLIRDSDPAI